MFDGWLSYYVNTESGARLRNPRGSIMLPKGSLVEMLRAAFNAGAAIKSAEQGQLAGAAE